MHGVSIDAFQVACVFTLSLDTIRSAVEAFHTRAPMLHIYCLFKLEQMTSCYNSRHSVTVIFTVEIESKRIENIIYELYAKKIAHKQQNAKIQLTTTTSRILIKT